MGEGEPPHDETPEEAFEKVFQIPLKFAVQMAQLPSELGAYWTKALEFIFGQKDGPEGPGDP